MGTIEVIKKFIESNSVIEKAVREVLERLPLRYRPGISYGPTFRYWLGFLKESEKWDRDKIEAYQVEQLRDLLMHAGENVPYYRRSFGEYGFKPEKIQALSDIKSLPYLDKVTIKENHHEFIADNIHKNKLIAAATSGTTGMPLIVYGTKETEEKHWATIIDLWSRIGYSPHSRTVFVEANIREGKKDSLPWKKYGNKLILSSNYFVDEWIDEYSEMINNFKAEYLIGFPHAVATFASSMRNRGKSLCNELKGVIVYAENVYEWQREIIKDVFGARVFSDYGMVEKVIHGGECEQSGVYHLYPQYGYTEYLPVRDSMCELFGTGFINYAMPLIRYVTGDIARKGDSCPLCGRSYEVLESMEGRFGDFLIGSEGQVFSVYLNIDYRVLENIERFQLYQERPGEVELRIYTTDSYKEENADRVLSEMRRSLGLYANRLRFVVAVYKDGQSSSGKYRMVDQKLDIRDFLRYKLVSFSNEAL